MQRVSFAGVAELFKFTVSVHDYAAARYSSRRPDGFLATPLSDLIRVVRQQTCCAVLVAGSL